MNGLNLIELLAFVYRTQGRAAVERMLTVPQKTLEKRADVNRDERSEMVDKFRGATSSLLDAVEEYVNLDND